MIGNSISIKTIINSAAASRFKYLKCKKWPTDPTEGSNQVAAQ